MKKYSPEELLKLGIIDNEKYDLLVEKNVPKKESKLSINIFFNILAGILLALGIIWVIAANWRLIPDYLILAILMLATVGSAAWTIIWKNKSKNLELPSLIYAGFSIGTIAYIGQYFNVAGNTALFLLMCLLIIASISFYTKSIVLSMAYLLFGAIYYSTFELFLVDAFNVPSIIGHTDISFWLGLVNPIVYMLIPICYVKFIIKDEYIKNANEEETKLLNKVSTKFKRRYARVFFILSLFVFVVSLLNGIECIGEIALLGILLLAITSKLRGWEFHALKWVSIGVILLASCSGIYSSSTPGEAIIIIAIGIIYFVTKTKLNIFKQIKEYKNDKENKVLGLEVQKGIELLIIFTGLFLIFLDNLFAMIWDANFVWEVYLVFIIAWAIYSIIDGIKNSRLKEFTFGEFLLTFEIFRFIFAFEDDLMIRGISAIIIAVVILIFNGKQSKKIKVIKSEGGKNE